jgi:hypothetical protein
MARGKKTEAVSKDNVTRITERDGTVVEEVVTTKGDKYHKRTSTARSLIIEKSYYNGGA